MTSAAPPPPSRRVAGAPRPDPPQRPLLWAAAAMAAGIAADRAAPVAASPAALATVGAVAAAVLAIAWVARRRGREHLGAALVLTAVAMLGALWHHGRWNYFSVDDLGRFARDAPQPTCVEGVVVKHVSIAPAGAHDPLRAIPSRPVSEATVRLAAIRDGQRWRPAAGRARLRVAGELRGVAPGDRVVVFAQLGRQPPPLNPGQFDWRNAERRERRLSELYCTDVRCVTVVGAEGWGWSRRLDQLRQATSRQLAASVGPERAPLVLATLLGNQELLSDDVKQAFFRTGSIHLLVISGAHIAMLGVATLWGARLAGLSLAAQRMVTALAVMLYAALVGFEPSVTRASLLALAMLAALSLGRRASAGNLLGLAAIVVLALNPADLFRSGAQFSFLAVAALVLGGRWVMRPRPVEPLTRLIAATRPWPVRAARSAGLSAWRATAASLIVGAAVAPLVASWFGVLTPASVLLTPLASPLVAAAITAGLATVTLGAIVPPLAPWLGATCGTMLQGVEWLVTQVAGWPGAYAYCSSPGPWWAGGLYAAAALCVAAPRLRPGGGWLISGAMLWGAMGLASLAALRPAHDELRCTFLAVGHGTCAVLELPGGQTLLYDAGSLAGPETTTRTIAGFLRSRGIARIDALVISHADVDHYNAMPGLLEQFPIGVVYVSPMMFDPLATDGQLAAPEALRAAAVAQRVPLREIWMNDRLRTTAAEVTIDVLHPPREGVLGRDNANSLVLTVEYAGRRILLPGDLEAAGLESVLAEPPLDCDVLLAPHHGSPLSDPPGFAAWCTPEWVVMSGGREDRTGDAPRAYELAGAQVFHTATAGAVEFRLTAAELRVSTYVPKTTPKHTGQLRKDE